jgi:hypothetical protein
VPLLTFLAINKGSKYNQVQQVLKKHVRTSMILSTLLMFVPQSKSRSHGSTLSLDGDDIGAEKMSLLSDDSLNGSQLNISVNSGTVCASSQD